MGHLIKFGKKAKKCMNHQLTIGIFSILIFWCFSIYTLVDTSETAIMFLHNIRGKRTVKWCNLIKANFLMPSFSSFGNSWDKNHVVVQPIKFFILSFMSNIAIIIVIKIICCLTHACQWGENAPKSVTWECFIVYYWLFYWS